MRAFFLGAVPSADLSSEDVGVQSDLSTPVLMQRIGHNTGNMLIGHSVLRHLSPGKWSADYNLKVAEIEENYDHIVIPASNFLYSGYDLSGMADFVERIKLPCTMIGVGSQAPTYDSKIELQPGTLRLLKVVSERSKSIGARGHFTADWLNKFGIKNVEVIGCPSFFWTCLPTLSVNKKPFGNVLNIAINASRNVINHSPDPKRMRLIETQILRQALQFKCEFFVQNEYNESILARGKSDEINDSIFSPILDYYGADAQDEATKIFFRDHCRIFFDIPSWADAIKQFDFSIGTRFHGNMIALQNGVPAVVIVHDVRTQELCELLHIPFLKLKDIKRFSLEWIYEMANFESTSAVYNQLFNNYINFLEANGLPHILQKQHALPKSSGMNSYRAVQKLLLTYPEIPEN